MINDLWYKNAIIYCLSVATYMDRTPERLELARSLGAITVDYSADDVSVLVALKDLTGGTGLDVCIDAVGLEAHSADLQAFMTSSRTRCF
jgi:threonine dehydrogenase-like Zn-dependent dehydrogenase